VCTGEERIPMGSNKLSDNFIEVRADYRMHNLDDLSLMGHLREFDTWKREPEREPILLSRFKSTKNYENFMIEVGNRYNFCIKELGKRWLKLDDENEREFRKLRNELFDIESRVRGNYLQLRLIKTKDVWIYV
jgi:hypothetical protein